MPETDIKEQIQSELEKEISALEAHGVVESPPPNEFEQLMIARGWNPKGPKSAQQWLDDGWNFRDTKVESLYKTVDNLKNLMDKQEKAAYERAVADLSMKRIEAIENGDVQRVNQIDHAQNQLSKPPFDVELEQQAGSFRHRNKEWLEGTSYMELKIAEVAHKKDQELVYRGLPPSDHFKALENYLHGEFPDYFGKKEPQGQAVEGGQSPVIKTGKKSSYSIDDLDDIQKSIARRFAKNGVMTIDAYIKELVKLGDLK